MPNYCDCELMICGKQDEVERFLEAAKSKETLIDMENFIPYPKEYKDADEAHERAVKEFNKLPKEEQERQWREGRDTPYQVKDGFNSGGCEWRIENWGTKWNINSAELTDDDIFRKGKPDEERCINLEFHTAWNPPTPVIKKMGEMFPKLEFILRYFEKGMEFNGILQIKKGEIERDERATYFGHRGG